MGLKLLIVVVLISTLILFFHIWYIITISERKVHLGMRFAYRQLGLGLMDIRDRVGIGLLILLLTGMGTSQPTPTWVCAEDGK